MPYNIKTGRQSHSQSERQQQICSSTQSSLLGALFTFRCVIIIDYFRTWVRHKEKEKRKSWILGALSLYSITETPSWPVWTQVSWRSIIILRAEVSGTRTRDLRTWVSHLVAPSCTLAGTPTEQMDTISWNSANSGEICYSSFVRERLFPPPPFLRVVRLLKALKRPKMGSHLSLDQFKLLLRRINIPFPNFLIINVPFQ